MNILKNMLSKQNKPIASIEEPWNTDSNKTVLVIDDSKTALFSAKQTVNLLGFSCLLANDVVEGIQAADELLPDLILMDVEMPKMNGFQATRILRAKSTTCDIPIIIVSGTDSPANRMWSEKIGANGFLPKPLDGKTLNKLAKELIFLRLPKVS
ncbi:MAG: response regulator [Gammaproteobacteria bacterium]|nr:response regulator [Gammaproteobacteria bacterium]MDH5803132.1 response regulator [Gammaproteobacteria bacterium]